MPPFNGCTLTEYLEVQRSRFPDAGGDPGALILDVAMVCKAIGRAVAFGQLGDPLGHAACTAGIPGEVTQNLGIASNSLLIQAAGRSGQLAGIASADMELPCQLRGGGCQGRYLLLFDPLDGSAGIDVNATVGSIFSVLRAPDEVGPPAFDVTHQHFLQPGSAQVAAGYALYGPVTMLVLTVGSGVAGFTLDPDLGEFKLSHPGMQVPEDTREFAIDASNSRFWEPPVKRYVDECVAGTMGPRGKDFNMRWIASMAAEAHRILMRGGVFLCPLDARDPSSAGRFRLLHEANPVGMLMEQAGARASTGRQPLLGVQPSSLHEKTGLVFGSKNEVERIERYHAASVLLGADARLHAGGGAFLH